MPARLEQLVRQTQVDIEGGNGRNFTMGRFAHNLNSAFQVEKSQGNGIGFLEDILDESTKIQSELPTPLREKGETILGKQQPSLVEALQETAKRFLFVDRLIKDLPSTVIGVIVGGSMQYGPFYNIRGTPNSSDLDIFYVVTQDFFKGKDAERTISRQRGFNSNASEDFARRAKIFRKLHSQKKADLLSVKTPVEDYLASVKVLPLETFVNEFDTNLKDVLDSGDDRSVGIKDYKQEPYFASVYTQYSFLHEPYPFHMDEEYPTEGGSITNLPCIIVLNGHLHTGQHHNHVTPCLEVEYDSQGQTSKAINHFKEYMQKRLNQERSRSTDPTKLEFVNSQDRKPLLSPQIIERARREIR